MTDMRTDVVQYRQPDLCHDGTGWIYVLLQRQDAGMAKPAPPKRVNLVKVRKDGTIAVRVRSGNRLVNIPAELIEMARAGLTK